MKALTILIFIIGFSTISAQTQIRVMSYNVENLLDTLDNPVKHDNEFTPDGERHWSAWRYWHKLRQIAKVITAAGEWEPPTIIGLCEVENDSVMRHLTHYTPLRMDGYRYIITKGPDTRGINVALMYQRDKFRHIGHESIPVKFSGKRVRPTRDILHVSGELICHDTLDIFVCHFPSRYGGEIESEKNRIDAAKTLKGCSDSIKSIRSNPLIIIIGDFNDTPSNKSIRNILGAEPIYGSGSINEDKLNGYFNIIPKFSESIKGTHKYQGEWSQIDQMIVNGRLLGCNSLVHVSNEWARIFAPEFLLINDKTWRGKRPFRTFHGFRYEGGFSDHLPLIMDIIVNESSHETYTTKGR